MTNGKYNIPSLFIRLGLAFVFIYAAITMYLKPDLYAHYLPSFMTIFLPSAMMLHLLGIYEIILSLWLLSGKGQKFSATLVTLTIFGITIVNLNEFGTLFRNVSIFFSGLALIAMNSNKK